MTMINLILILLCAVASAQPSVATKFERDVRVLASDRMEGRGIGTHGIELAWVDFRQPGGFGQDIAPAGHDVGN